MCLVFQLEFMSLGVFVMLFGVFVRALFFLTCQVNKRMCKVSWVNMGFLFGSNIEMEKVDFG